MSITAITWMAAAVEVILTLALGYVLLHQRRQCLGRRFGREYEHALNEQDNRGEAEPDLRAQKKRVATLDIMPLTPEARQTYTEQWTTLQERFVAAPGPAVTVTAELVTAAMADRGYPTEDFDQQMSDLSVEHSRTLHHYRQVREISRRAARGDASTEDLRQAMVHYRVLFEDLLDIGDEHHPQPAKARHEQPALPATPSKGDSTWTSVTTTNALKRVSTNQSKCRSSSPYPCPLWNTAGPTTPRQQRPLTSSSSTRGPSHRPPCPHH